MFFFTLFGWLLAIQFLLHCGNCLRDKIFRQTFLGSLGWQALPSCSTLLHLSKVGHSKLYLPPSSPLLQVHWIHFSFFTCILVLQQVSAHSSCLKTFVESMTRWTDSPKRRLQDTGRKSERKPGQMGVSYGEVFYNDITQDVPRGEDCSRWVDVTVDIKELEDLYVWRLFCSNSNLKISRL
jgi:hypothetical protein